jgi:translation initiation factor IF-1
MVVNAVVVEELPGLLFRLELGNQSQVLAHGAGTAIVKDGAAVRNWVRLLPGDRVEVELAEQDPTRGRILKKLG